MVVKEEEEEEEGEGEEKKTRNREKELLGNLTNGVEREGWSELTLLVD